MNKGENEKKTNLNQEELEKVSGGVLSDDEVKEFFPNSKHGSLFKNQYDVAVCQKCGKRFARFAGAIGLGMTGREIQIFNIQQVYCQECAKGMIKGPANPLADIIKKK